MNPLTKIRSVGLLRILIFSTGFHGNIGSRAIDFSLGYVQHLHFNTILHYGHKNVEYFTEISGPCSKSD